MADTLYKVETGSVGPDTKPIYDVFFGNEHIQDPSDPRLKGINIPDLPGGTAPSGFQSAFNAPMNTDIANPVGSSDASPLKLQADKLQKEITAGLANYGITPPAQAGVDPNAQSFADRQTQLDQRKAEDTASIDKSFQLSKEQLQADQETQLAQATGRTRIGGFFTQLEAQDILKMEQQHSRNIAALEGQHQSSLQEARRAYEDENYKLASDKVKEAKDYQAQIDQQKQTYFNNVLQYQQMRTPITEANDAIRKWAIDSMTKYPSGFANLSPTDLTNLTPADIQAKILASTEYKQGIAYKNQQIANEKRLASGYGLIGGGSGGGTGTGTGTGIGLSDTGTNFWAQAASSGVNMNSLLPSLGMGTAAVATKSRLLEKIASNAQTLGIDGATFGAMVTDSRAKQKAYSSLQQVGAQTLVNENNANKNFQQLIGLAQKVDAGTLNTSIPFLNEWIRSGQLKASGNANVNNFMALLTTSLTEYAKVVSGTTSGAAVSDTANRQAQDLLSRGMNTKTIQSFAQTAAQEMKNRTDSYNSALQGLFGDIKNLEDSTGGLGGVNTDMSTIESDIKTATNDTANYQSREQLAQDISNHYGISIDDAQRRVNQIWTDNLKR